MTIKTKKKRQFEGIGLQHLEIHATGEIIELFTYGFNTSILKKIIYRFNMQDRILNMKMADFKNIICLSGLPIIYFKSFNSRELERHPNQYVPLFYAVVPLSDEEIGLLDEQFMQYITDLNESFEPFEERLEFRKCKGSFKVGQELNGTARFTFEFSDNHPFAPNAYSLFPAIVGRYLHQSTVQLNDKNKTKITLSQIHDPTISSGAVKWVSEEIFEESYVNKHSDIEVRNYWSYEVIAKIVTHPFMSTPFLTFDTNIKRWSSKTYKHTNNIRGKFDKTRIYICINRDLFPESIGGHVVLNLPNRKDNWSKVFQNLLKGLTLPQLPEVKDIQQNPLQYLNDRNLIVKVVYDQTSTAASHLVSSGPGWEDRYLPFFYLSEKLLLNPIVGIKLSQAETLKIVQSSQLKKIVKLSENINFQCIYFKEETFKIICNQMSRILNTTPILKAEKLIYKVNDFEVILQGINLNEYFEGEFLKFENEKEYSVFEKRLSEIIPQTNTIPAILFELPGKDSYSQANLDPKIYLRRFFIGENKISQFIEPPKVNENEVHEVRVEKSLFDLFNKYNILFKGFDNFMTKLSLEKQKVHLIGAYVIEKKIVYVRIYNDEKWICMPGILNEWRPLSEGWIYVIKEWPSYQNYSLTKDNIIQMLQQLESMYPNDLFIFTFVRSNFNLNGYSDFNSFGANNRLDEVIYEQLERTHFVQIRRSDEAGEYFGVELETLKPLANGIVSGICRMGERNFASLAIKSTPMQAFAKLNYQSKLDYTNKPIAKPKILLITPFGHNHQLNREVLADIIHKSRTLNVGSSKARKTKKVEPVNEPNVYKVENDAATILPYPIHLIEKLKSVLKELGKIQ